MTSGYCGNGVPSVGLPPEVIISLLFLWDRWMKWEPPGAPLEGGELGVQRRAEPSGEGRTQVVLLSHGVLAPTPGLCMVAVRFSVRSRPSLETQTCHFAATGLVPSGWGRRCWCW